MYSHPWTATKYWSNNQNDFRCISAEYLTNIQHWGPAATLYCAAPKLDSIGEKTDGRLQEYKCEVLKSVLPCRKVKGILTQFEERFHRRILEWRSAHYTSSDGLEGNQHRRRWWQCFFHLLLVSLLFYLHLCAHPPYLPLKSQRSTKNIPVDLSQNVLSAFGLRISSCHCRYSRNAQ